MAFVNRNPNAYVDTHKNIVFLPTAPTVVRQQEDAGPWTHEIVIGHGSDNHMAEATR